jgi:AcrR family transcriptional regulator
MTKRRDAAPTARPSVDMETKTQPLQERSRQTYEAILQASGELLAEVGIEKLSTNLICKRAALTPPALYRYFPNKYALLKELGERLMQAQDAAVYAWIGQGGLENNTTDEMFAANRRILSEVIRVTARFPGGLWILRAMRAVPLMREVRIHSSRTVADRLFQSLRDRYPAVSSERLRRAALLTTEVSNFVVEMVLEDPGSEADNILDEACWMIAAYFGRMG